MEKEYGQKAPTLPDGSILLQEMKLSAEQTANFKSDKTSVRAAQNHTLWTSLLIGFLSISCYTATVSMAIRNLSVPEAEATPISVICGILILGLILGRHFSKSGERLAQKMVDIVKASKTAPDVTRFFARYMPGDNAIQSWTYMRLLMDSESELGTNQSYRVKLDTSDSERYLVREVIVPKAS